MRSSVGEASKLVAEPKRVLEGFGHPAVVTVAAVLIISRALRNSGVVDQISRSVMPFTKNQTPAHPQPLAGGHGVVRLHEQRRRARAHAAGCDEDGSRSSALAHHPAIADGFCQHPGRHDDDDRDAAKHHYCQPACGAD